MNKHESRIAALEQNRQRHGEVEVLSGIGSTARTGSQDPGEHMSLAPLFGDHLGLHRPPAFAAARLHPLAVPSVLELRN